MGHAKFDLFGRQPGSKQAVRIRVWGMGEASGLEIQILGPLGFRWNQKQQGRGEIPEGRVLREARKALGCSDLGGVGRISRLMRWSEPKKVGSPMAMPRIEGASPVTCYQGELRTSQWA